MMYISVKLIELHTSRGVNFTEHKLYLSKPNEREGRREREIESEQASKHERELD